MTRLDPRTVYTASYGFSRRWRLLWENEKAASTPAQAVAAKLAFVGHRAEEQQYLNTIEACENAGDLRRAWYAAQTHDLDRQQFDALAAYDNRSGKFAAMQYSQKFTNRKGA